MNCVNHDYSKFKTDFLKSFNKFIFYNFLIIVFYSFLFTYITDLSTWENCLPWDFDYNSIKNTTILVGEIKNCWYLPLDFSQQWPNNSNIAAELVLAWKYVAITKKTWADGCSGIFTLHSSSI